MASVLSHPAIALGLGPLFASKGVERRAWALGAACAVAPDIDVIGFDYGIPYGDLFGHRGITHSLTSAAAFASRTGGREILARRLPERSGRRGTLAGKLQRR